MILRFVLFRATSSRATFWLYFILSLPAFVIEFWLEKIGRPTFAPTGELTRSGEDLEAQGLTEYLWDVLYWSWGCIGLASLFGNRAWWAWLVIPLYSIWLVYTTFGGMKKGLVPQGGFGEDKGSAGASNRQKKLEKRGGQRVQYR